MSSSTIEVTDATFQEKVIDNQGIVLVDFWAPWCGPCKMLTPIVEEVAKTFAGKVSVLKMNIDENPDSPSNFGIRSIPTLKLFKAGEIKDTKIGLLTKEQIVEWVESYL